MADPGFMIPLNLNDFLFPFEGGTRDICSAAKQQTYTHAPWWTSENVQLTTGGNQVPSAVVGTPYVIQVGIAGAPGGDGTTPGFIQRVQAWVCFPNTVPGGASGTLVVPSMRNNEFASFSNTTANAPIIFSNAEVSDYQKPGTGWQTISLSAWTPTQEDFLEEQSSSGGHVCMIVNAAGQASLDDISDPNSGIPVGVVITDQSQLSADFDICHSLYQAQRNTMIVAAGGGGFPGGGAHIGFLAGAPERSDPVKSMVEVTAIDQGGQIDPVLLNALSSGPYSSLPLQPASAPPKSLRLTRHDLHHHSWLAKLIHEAEEIVDELLGLDKHSFGGGHQLRLSLPPKGLQPLRVVFELDPNEPPGTVHALDITQTDVNGARGGIRAGLVVTP